MCDIGEIERLLCREDMKCMQYLACNGFDENAEQSMVLEERSIRGHRYLRHAKKQLLKL